MPRKVSGGAAGSGPILEGIPPSASGMGYLGAGQQLSCVRRAVRWARAPDPVVLWPIAHVVLRSTGRISWNHVCRLGFQRLCEEAEGCETLYARVLSREAEDLRCSAAQNVVSSGMTTSRQFGTCRRRHGSPGDQKRQAGQKDACFFKNTTRTIERSDVSFSFVSGTAVRIVLGQNTRPAGQSPSQQKVGCQGIGCGCS